MSSGQSPRTPRYFPRMKVRGARRKQQRAGVVSVWIGPDFSGLQAAMTRFALSIEALKHINTKEAHGEY